MYNSDMNLFLKKSTFYFLLAGTIIMMFLMLLTGRDLKTTATPLGIIDLELASTKTAVQNILNVWDNQVLEGNKLITKARVNTFLDFIFLLFYSLFLFTCCKTLASSLSHKKTWQTILHRCAAMAILSGLLDIVENTGMLLSLSHYSSSTIAPITAIAAYLKWALVVATLLLIITAFMVKIMERKKQEAV